MISFKTLSSRAKLQSAKRFKAKSLGKTWQSLVSWFSPSLTLHPYSKWICHERRKKIATENFENKYENIYKRMGEACISEKDEIEIQYEEELPSKYTLASPDYLLFVNKTSCNTNDLNYTILPFIYGTGVPVLYGIFF